MREPIFTAESASDITKMQLVLFEHLDTGEWYGACFEDEFSAGDRWPEGCGWARVFVKGYKNELRAVSLAECLARTTNFKHVIKSRRTA